MLIILSPAKALDFERPVPIPDRTAPQFVGRSKELIKELRSKSPHEIASLMSLSDSLAALNVARYSAWRPKFTEQNSRQAIFAFDGDVYEGLDAGRLSRDDLFWAQDHIAILSGLYGILRPLDQMQPYRLEMGTRLATARGNDLYGFWGDTLAMHLNASLERLQSPLLVNLASQEYFKSVKRKVLQAQIVDCVFEDRKSGSWKIISFFAKRARGLMARHAIVSRAQSVDDLLSFNAEGYSFAEAASTEQRLIFRRSL